MRIIVIGGAGTIGKAVVAALSDRHDVVIAGRRSGTVQVDIQSPDSVRDMYRQAGSLALGIYSKLLGQIRLVLLGRTLISDGGSFTLMSGYVLDDPTPEATGFAVANGGVEGFVRAAAITLARGVRINAVSPGLAEDRAEAGLCGRSRAASHRLESTFRT